MSRPVTSAPRHTSAPADPSRTLDCGRTPRRPPPTRNVMSSAHPHPYALDLRAALEPHLASLNPASAPVLARLCGAEACTPALLRRAGSGAAAGGGGGGRQRRRPRSSIENMSTQRRPLPRSRASLPRQLGAQQQQQQQQQHCSSSSSGGCITAAAAPVTAAAATAPAARPRAAKAARAAASSLPAWQLRRRGWFAAWPRREWCEEPLQRSRRGRARAAAEGKCAG